MTRLPLFAIVCLSWAAAHAGRTDENLVKNPGFEQGADGPDHWTFNHRGTNTEIVWDKTRAGSGEAAVRIANSTRAESGNVFQVIRLDPPLEPGSCVDFSARAATRDLEVDGPRIVVYLQQASGGRDTVAASGTGGTHDFVEIRGQTRVRFPTAALVVYLCNYGLGTVWWDDVRVTVERAATQPVPPRPESERTMPPLATGDGLELVLSGSGGVADVRLDGTSLAAPATASGLWLKPFGEGLVPVTGQMTAEDGSIRQHFEDDAAGLRVEAVFRVEEAAVRCDGRVHDLAGRDRGVDVLFSLPVGGPDWRWGKSIREEVPTNGAYLVLDGTTFSSLSRPTGEGLALAVPADAPCDFEITSGGDLGHAVRFHFGLSRAARGELKGRAPFSFVVYRCDGRWGLRDAARRYYELWPRAFHKRVCREGLWMFGSAKFPLPDPGNYAFHEGGPAGWEYDDRHGIATCPYIIPGQREITGLQTLPASTQEAVEVLNSLPPPDAEAAQVPGRSVATDTAHSRDRRGWGASKKAIIENGMLLDASGRPQLSIRNTAWGGNSVTFPLNASPWLLGDTDEPTVAKALLGYVAELLDAIPQLDGIYVDSLGAWGNYLNYREEHFAATRVPLSYDQNTGRPVLPNRFTLLEFLWRLGDELHARDKLLFANGVHPNRRFHFFALDVMGVEGRGRMEQKRVMAFQKPFLLLIYGIHDDPAAMERHFHRCTLYGIYPSFANMRVYETPEMYAPVAALNDRFVPVLQAITAAGWQPITHATSSDADVWVERWGPGADGRVYWTAYNSADESRSTRLTIDAASLGLVGETVRIEDRLGPDAWSVPRVGDSCRLDVAVPPGQVRVLRLEGRGE